MIRNFTARKDFMRPFLVGTGIGVACALAALGGAFASWRARTVDRFFTPEAPDPSILIVAIDDASISSIGRWPWSRSVHAELIRKLATAGASVIAYDVNFSEPQDAASDRDLADAISHAHRSVLPVELRLDERVSGPTTYQSGLTLRPIPELAAAATALGHTNITPDADGVVRHLPIRVADEHGEHSVSSFALQIAALADRMPDLNGREGTRIRFDGAPHVTFPTVSAAAILAPDADLSSVRNKIVLVGSTATDLHDEAIVPTSEGVPMPGIEIHASLLDTILRNNWLIQIPDWQLAIILVFIGVLVGFVAPRLRPRQGLVFVIFAWLAVVIAASAAFDRGIVFDLFWPTLALGLSYGGITLERRLAGERHRRQLRGLLARYVSPAVVEEILHDPDRLRLGGERKTATILFSDIRKFAHLAEHMDPEGLVHLLNTFFGRMTDVVFMHGGVLDKYLGDAVMAFWNAPISQPDHAERAVSAALDMRSALRELNRSHAFGPRELAIGIGINTGEAVVGNIGGSVHTDYTVIGDAVNVASRSEGLTKIYGVPIIATQPTVDALGDAYVVRRLDRVAVHGKMNAVTICEIVGRADRVSEKGTRLIAAYESALAAYAARKFDDAIAACDRILAAAPGDRPTHLMRERAEAFRRHPPTADWDGTWVWREK